MNIINERYGPIISKNVIESLTMGIFKTSFSIYQEYVQNAINQIDIAKQQGFNNLFVDIQIDQETKTIIIQDNAIGVEQKNILFLFGNIAQSTKSDCKIKIGRFCGLGYCDKLIFETSHYGENTKSTMLWDAKRLKEILKDDTIKIGNAELISIMTNYSYDYDEDINTHYFKVIMEGVTHEELLDIEKTQEYLSTMELISFSTDIAHKELSQSELETKEYKISLNGKPLSKKIKKISDSEKFLFSEENVLIRKIYNIIHQNPQMCGEKLIQKIGEIIRK